MDKFKAIRITNMISTDLIRNYSRSTEHQNVIMHVLQQKRNMTTNVYSKTNHAPSTNDNTRPQLKVKNTDGLKTIM